ncbi:hypothetical protein V1478_011332, partial [Vespula squamosa]
MDGLLGTKREEAFSKFHCSDTLSLPLLFSAAHSTSSTPSRFEIAMSEESVQHSWTSISLREGEEEEEAEAEEEEEEEGEGEGGEGERETRRDRDREKEKERRRKRESRTYVGARPYRRVHIRQRGGETNREKAERREKNPRFPGSAAPVDSFRASQPHTGRNAEEISTWPTSIKRLEEEEEEEEGEVVVEEEEEEEEVEVEEEEEEEEANDEETEKERRRESERDLTSRKRVGEETQFETSEFEYGRPQAETMGTSMDHTGCEQMSSANSLKFYSLDSLGISTINPYMFECSFYDPRGNVRGSVIDKGTSNSVLVDRKERTRYPDEEEKEEEDDEIGGGRRRTFCEIDTERRSYRAGPTRVTYYRVGTKSNTICA